MPRLTAGLREKPSMFTIREYMKLYMDMIRRDMTAYMRKIIRYMTVYTHMEIRYMIVYTHMEIRYMTVYMHMVIRYMIVYMPTKIRYMTVYTHMAIYKSMTNANMTTNSMTNSERLNVTRHDDYISYIMSSLDKIAYQTIILLSTVTVDRMQQIFACLKNQIKNNNF